MCFVNVHVYVDDAYVWCVFVCMHDASFVFCVCACICVVHVFTHTICTLQVIGLFRGTIPAKFLTADLRPRGATAEQPLIAVAVAHEDGLPIVDALKRTLNKVGVSLV